MSKAEDYLDGLLNSLESKGQQPGYPSKPEPTPGESAAAQPKKTEADDEFLDSFEKEFLADDDVDDFIRQFERELDQDGGTSSDDAFLGSLDGIMDDVKEKLKEESVSAAEELFEEPVEKLFEEPIEELSQEFSKESSEELGLSNDANDDLGDFMVDTIGEFGEMDEKDDAFSGLDMDGDGLDGMSGLVDEDQDLMSLLQSEGDFSDIGDLLKADEENVEISDGSEDGLGFSMDELTGETDAVLDEILSEVAGEEEPEGKKSKAKKAKKEKKAKKGKDEDMPKEGKPGFFKNLIQSLFGEDDEAEETETLTVAASSAPSAGELSDENAQILKELEGGGETAESKEAGPSPEEEKAKKKREKKEKQEKAKKAKKEKKEQAKKAKAQKPKKEKKPKKPKEPDNTPPLPKKPVMLIFVMAASLLVLVMIGTNYVGYTGSIMRAEQAYGLGNYKEAYQELSGMKLDEDDMAFYQRCRILEQVSGLYDSYRSFMEAGIYDMALDSLVRASGRCEKYAEDAAEYGCAEELEKLRSQAAGALGSFGISEERALELYAIDDRQDYSIELYAVLETAGFDVANAE